MGSAYAMAERFIKSFKISDGKKTAHFSSRNGQGMSVFSFKLKNLSGADTHIGTGKTPRLRRLFRKPSDYV